MLPDIAWRRLHNQRLTRAHARRPADVVRWFGAVQAQEYAAARWGLALRLPERTTDLNVEQAFEAGQILRTHVMRPTWHFVTPEDIRWMLELTAPRVHRTVAGYNRRLGLDGPLLVRATTLIERAIGDHGFLTRAELGVHLARAGLALDSIRLAHVALHAELEGVICSGPRRGTRFTYALLASRAPGAVRLPRDEALARLTRRYFTSHGPATVRDFVWWSGLTAADAKRGLEMTGARRLDAGGRTYWTIGRRPPPAARAAGAHLLPVYDEYVVAYRDREAVPHAPRHVGAGPRAAVMFQNPLIVGGAVAGTWKVSRSASGAQITIGTFRRLTPRERRMLEDAAARYGRFVGAPARLTPARPGPA